MRTFLSVLALVILPHLVHAQASPAPDPVFREIAAELVKINTRIDAVETRTAGLAAKVEGLYARQTAVADSRINQQLESLSARLDALVFEQAKASPGTPTSVASNPWASGQPAGGMMFTSNASYGAGGCSSGSCSSSAARRGLLGRRR